MLAVFENKIILSENRVGISFVSFSSTMTVKLPLIMDLVHNNNIFVFYLRFLYKCYANSVASSYGLVSKMTVWLQKAVKNERIRSYLNYRKLLAIAMCRSSISQ